MAKQKILITHLLTADQRGEVFGYIFDALYYYMTEKWYLKFKNEQKEVVFIPFEFHDEDDAGEEYYVPGNELLEALVDEIRDVPKKQEWIIVGIQSDVYEGVVDYLREQGIESEFTLRYINQLPVHLIVLLHGLYVPFIPLGNQSYYDVRHLPVPFVEYLNNTRPVLLPVSPRVKLLHIENTNEEQNSNYSTN